jgi:hypothetical protein
VPAVRCFRGESGTCTLGRGFGGVRPDSRIVDRDSARFGVSKQPSRDSGPLFAFARRSFFSFSLASMAWSFSCNVSSSSSSSSSSTSLAARRVPPGVGEGDWHRLRSYFFRPEGELSRASSGDLGGHGWSG